MQSISQTDADSDSFRLTARLVAICWARQLQDAGEPTPDLRRLTARILREVRA